MINASEMPDGWEQCPRRDDLFRRFARQAKVEFESGLDVVFTTRDRGADILLLIDHDPRFIRLDCNVFFTQFVSIGISYGISLGGYPGVVSLLDYPIPKNPKRDFILVSDSILGFEHEYSFDMDLDGDVEANYSNAASKISSYIDEYGRRSFAKLLKYVGMRS